MGILQQIRTRFGADVADSVALTRALDDLNAKLDKNREAMLALEEALPVDVIKSIDLGATSRRKLAGLQSEHQALLATIEATRREIADARDRERAAEHYARVVAVKNCAARCQAKYAELQRWAENGADLINGSLESSTEFTVAMEGLEPADWNRHDARDLGRWLTLALFAATANEALRPAGCALSAYALKEKGWGNVADFCREWLMIATRGLDAAPESEASVSTPTEESAHAS